MKTILIISYSPLSRDPRVRRQIEHLKRTYNIIAVGLDNPLIEDVKYIQYPSLFFTNIGDKISYILGVLQKNYERFYWKKNKELYDILTNESFDLIISNDPEPLPLVARLAEDKNIKFIADMHEYSPRENEGSIKWNLLFKSYKTYLCRQYLSRASSITTVCQGIAEEYMQAFDLNNIEVVTNAPDYNNSKMRSTIPNEVRIVHHGAASSSRRIENMLETMKYVDTRFHLDLYLVPGDEDYLNKLKKKYSKYQNISFKEPVVYTDIIDMLSEYDIGLFILQPTNISYYHALPNKFFEFAQAGLAIAIGPSPEMASYLERYKCGIIAKDFTPKTMAKALNSLSLKDIQMLRNNSHNLAKENCSEINMKILQNIVRKFVSEV